MRQSITKLTSIALVGGLIGRGLRYSLNVLVSRGLGPEALGLFAFGMVLMKVLGVVARSGLDNAAQKFIPIHRRDGDAARLTGLTSICVGLPLVFGSILAGVVYLDPGFLTTLTGREFGEIARSFALGVPLFAAMMVGISATKGLKETKYSVYVRDFGQSIAAIALVAVGVFVFGDIQAAVLGYVGSFLVGLVLAVGFLVREGALRFDVRPTFDVRRVITYAVPLTITSVLGYVLTWTDVLVLSALTEPLAVGWYQAAYQTSVLLLVVLQSASAIFPAVVADLYHAGRHDRLRRTYSAMTKWITYVTLLAYLFVVVYAADILSVFEIAARPALVALIVVGFGQLISATAGPVGYLLTMTEYERVYVANTVFVVVVNAVLNVLLVLEYGVVGAAVATALSFALHNLLALGEVWYLLDVQPYSRRYWKGIVAVGCALPVMVLGRQLPIPGVPRLVLVAGVSFGVFGVSIWLLGIDDADRTLLESIG